MNYYFDTTQQLHTDPCVTYVKKAYYLLPVALVAVYFIVQWIFSKYFPDPVILPIPIVEAATTTQKVNAPVQTGSGNSLHYTFSTNGILQEAGSMDESSSPYFWLDSGGMFTITNGIGETIQGALGPFSYWRILYGVNNPLDTDGGKYPQNLFRLVTKGSWNNVVESMRFKLTELNMTNTPNRDGYSGVLLMSRYRDAMNLYYAGIRMDGTAVIKKKYKGTYYTLAETNVFSADSGYNKYTNPNLIPGDKWMSLKTETKTLQNGSVQISLWIDKQDSGEWQHLLTATDTPGTNGDGVIAGPAHVGIRTDYLDVQFADYLIDEE